MTRSPFLAWLGLVLALAPAPAGALDPGPPGPKLLTPSEQRALRSVETIYMWKMTDAVGLTDEQAARIFPRVREAFHARWPLAARRRHLLVLLRRAVEGDAGAEDLPALLAQWEDNEARLRASRQRMWEALTGALTPAQQVRCLLFEERFQGDLVRVVEEFRRTRDRSAAPRPPERTR